MLRITNIAASGSSLVSSTDAVLEYNTMDMFHNRSERNVTAALANLASTNLIADLFTMKPDRYQHLTLQTFVGTTTIMAFYICCHQTNILGVLLEEVWCLFDNILSIKKSFSIFVPLKGYKCCHIPKYFVYFLSIYEYKA